jgi:hypothetical protein
MASEPSPRSGARHDLPALHDLHEYAQTLPNEDSDPEGEEDYQNLGQLVAFTLNENGIAIPHSLAPQWRGKRS